MVTGAYTAGLEAAQQALLAGAILTSVATAVLAIWLRTRSDERTVTSLARTTPIVGCPDPCDPAVGLARLRFAHGEIDRDDFQRVIQAMSRTWQA